MPPIDFTRRTALYRLYDDADVLLYVGIAFDPEARWLGHSALQPWWPQVSRKTVEWHPDRLTARAMEKAAIGCELPKYNQTDKPHHVQPLTAWKGPRSYLRLGIREVKARLSDLVNRVIYRNEVIWVTKNNRRVAALVPIEVAEKYFADQDAAAAIAVEDHKAGS